MRVTWRGLELPTRVEKDTGVSTDRYSRFFIEPFERGFGTTVGNSLRRVLLSSLEGSAVTSIKIAGVEHEFTSIRGVIEDATDIVLNVKSLVIRLTGEGPKTMKVTANKAGVITAAQIVADPAIDVISKDVVLATLTEDVAFEMEMVVENGRGYVPVADRISDADRFEQEIGRIHLDAVYSPVTRVRYMTENTRVGQRTNYDKLILEIWTNGTITPEMAWSRRRKSFASTSIRSCSTSSWARRRSPESCRRRFRRSRSTRSWKPSSTRRSRSWSCPCGPATAWSR
jgi:DNA-directed RNA polymerase subunit alpha